MRALLLKYWDRLRSSFWFVPAVLACLAVALAVYAVGIHQADGEGWLKRLGWGYSGGADDASQRRFSRRTTVPAWSLTFAQAAEKVRDGDSVRSRVPAGDREKLGAERLHPMVTN